MRPIFVRVLSPPTHCNLWIIESSRARFSQFRYEAALCVIVTIDRRSRENYAALRRKRSQTLNQFNHLAAVRDRNESLSLGFVSRCHKPTLPGILLRREANPQFIEIGSGTTDRAFRSDGKGFASLRCKRPNSGVLTTAAKPRSGEGRPTDPTHAKTLKQFNHLAQSHSVLPQGGGRSQRFPSPGTGEGNQTSTTSGGSAGWRSVRVRPVGSWACNPANVSASNT